MTSTTWRVWILSNGPHPWRPGRRRSGGAARTRQRLWRRSWRNGQGVFGQVPRRRAGRDAAGGRKQVPLRRLGLPSLYADVLYALDAELDRIFETAGFDEPAAGIGDAPCVPEGATRHRILNIGRSVVFDNYGVKVRLDDFFGGHAAVLGNTGSGKSCTVASILQGLFEKPKEHHARGATFVVFDVNGEYEAALKSIEASGGLGCQYLVLDGTATPGRFRLPHWFLDQSEWELLLQASERTQVPILRLALGFTTLFSGPPGALVEVRNHILAKCITQILSDETTSPSKADRIQGILQRFNTPQINNGVIEKIH